MRDAHQGVPVAALPGAGSSGLLTNLFGGNSPAQDRASERSTVGQAPTPPAAIGVGASASASRNSASLDTWLIDKLFGR